MRAYCCYLSTILAFAALTDVASATWLPDGVPVCTYPPCLEANPRIAANGTGGVFVVWEDHRTLLVTDIYLQHLTAHGDRAPGWPADGLPVCVSTFGKAGPRVVADGQDGCFVTWYDERNAAATLGDNYIQHVQSDGTLAQGWPVNGLPVSLEPGGDYAAWPVLDGSGGLFVTWMAEVNTVNTVWIQHLTASGAPAPGWPSDGVAACTSPSLFAFSVPDGGGGAMMVWTDYRHGCVTPECYDVYGARFTAEGALASGWAVNGNLLVPGEWLAIPVADTAGVWYVISSTPTPDAFDASYSVRRLTADGTPAPGWTARGVVVGAAPGHRWGIIPTADQVGGVLLSWYEARGVIGARVLPSGTVAPGWPAEGLVVSDPTLGYDTNFGIAPDGTGGGYFSFQYDYPSAVQHITAAGTAAPGWPPYGFRLATTSAQFEPQLVPSSGGGSIAVWEERGGIGSRLGLFAQRFEPTGPTPTPVRLSLVSTEARQDRVVLLWDGPGAGLLIASVERRAEDGAWQRLGRASTASPDRLRYEDREVVAGSRYAYRLAVGGGGATDYTAESWVDVPLGYSVALAGFQPNPASGVPTVAFALADASPATLEVLDVSGRRLVARDVGGLGAGRHTLQLEGVALAPGIYWIRLAQSGTVRGSVRGLLMR
jgi:hypothetical protein